MSDAKRVSIPLAMSSNPCGEAFVISAVAPSVVVTATIDPRVWPPESLAALLENIAAAVRANGVQPADTDRVTWAEKPRGNA